MTTEEQRRQFGDRPTRAARQVIIDTVEQYAKSTGNYHLLNLVRRVPGDAQIKPAARATGKAIKPKLSPKERDFTSIVSVMDRLGGRPVGTTDLGRYRRRWLDYPPRNPDSAHRNRLEEVLEMMVQEGVLLATKTRLGATVYSPGPNYQSYQHANAI
ncbi:hypothetical protein AYO44_18375 [Planctomycetaceae bacterium SCGC AG-212-F19]|nr:hypothetical protein AYO44_18375 [Planctomycetaceae bacterium SCGC AG-212-F19]